MLRLVPFPNVGLDFLLGKLAHGPLDFLLFRTQFEIQDSPRDCLLGLAWPMKT